MKITSLALCLFLTVYFNDGTKMFFPNADTWITSTNYVTLLSRNSDRVAILAMRNLKVVVVGEVKDKIF